MVENSGYFDIGEYGDCGVEIFEKKLHEGFVIPTSISNKFSRIELEETVSAMRKFWMNPNLLAMS
ncbi:hypothetical protein Hanom_Chr09g00761671 [Helianthus anomalus]